MAGAAMTTWARGHRLDDDDEDGREPTRRLHPAAQQCVEAVAEIEAERDMVPRASGSGV